MFLFTQIHAVLECCFNCRWWRCVGWCGNPTE